MFMPAMDGRMKPEFNDFNELLRVCNIATQLALCGTIQHTIEHHIAYNDVWCYIEFHNVQWCCIVVHNPTDSHTYVYIYIYLYIYIYTDSYITLGLHHYIHHMTNADFNLRDG